MLLASFLFVQQCLHGKDGLHSKCASGEAPWYRCHQRGESSATGHAFIVPSNRTEFVPQSFTVFERNIFAMNDAVSARLESAEILFLH